MSALVTAPGCYAGIDSDTYHSGLWLPEQSLSSSGARKLVSACPAIFRHEFVNGTRRTKALDLGSAAHAWLLEPETWPGRHHILPDGYDGRATKKWGDAKAEKEAAEAAGKPVISHEDYLTIVAMREALHAKELARAAFTRGRTEQTLAWRDERYGIWCRARLDFLPSVGGIYADYKTCTTAEPTALSRHIATYGYHQQAAWYTEGIVETGLCRDPIFLFVFQEKTPPYLVVCATLKPKALIRGEQLNFVAKSRFAACLRSSAWPGYADGEVVEIDLPSWEHSRLDRMEETGLLDAPGIEEIEMEEAA